MNYRTQKRPHFETFCPHFAPYFPNFAPYWGAQGPPGPLLRCAYEIDSSISKVYIQNEFQEIEIDMGTKPDAEENSQKDNEKNFCDQSNSGRHE